MGRKYFGTDGIRGRANAKLTAELALKVGQAAGLVFQRGDHRHRVVIGKDTRLSSYMIEYAMVGGFTSVGMDVLLLGPVPTPAVAMLTRSMRCDLGVMISASHNLYEDNGIKLFGPDGFKLSDEIEKPHRGVDGFRSLRARYARSPDMGRARRVDDVVARYIEYAKRTLPRDVSLGGLQDRRRLRQRGRLQGRAGGACGNWGPRSSSSASSPMASTSTTASARPRPTSSPARCVRCARTSAWRSTATPTG